MVGNEIMAGKKKKKTEIIKLHKTIYKFGNSTI